MLMSEPMEFGLVLPNIWMEIDLNRFDTFIFLIKFYTHLIDHRHHFGILEKRLEIVHAKVADSDAPKMA